MAKQVVIIAEFPNDGRVWRIDWLAAVQRNDNVSTESTIEVYLRPIVDKNNASVAAHTKSISSATFESILERDFLSPLEFSDDVAQFEVQPVSIEWFDALGKIHTYVPDVLAHYKQSHHSKVVILYKVKYRNDLKENWSTFKPKFKAAIACCKARGWRFKLATEVGFAQHIWRTC